MHITMEDYGAWKSVDVAGKDFGYAIAYFPRCDKRGDFIGLTLLI